MRKGLDKKARGRLGEQVASLGGIEHGSRDGKESESIPKASESQGEHSRSGWKI